MPRRLTQRMVNQGCKLAAIRLSSLFHGREPCSKARTYLIQPCIWHLLSHYWYRTGCGQRHCHNTTHTCCEALPPTRSARAPTERRQFANVQQFARRAIGLGCVVAEVAPVAHDTSDGHGQLPKARRPGDPPAPVSAWLKSPLVEYAALSPTDARRTSTKATCVLRHFSRGVHKADLL